MSSASKEDLAWRIEQTCLHAWPALREMAVDGWLLRFAGGLSRRSNSVNPLSAAVDSAPSFIDLCEAHYRAENLPAIFRIPSVIEPSTQGRLEERGYAKEGESVVLYADIGGMRMITDADVDISTVPSPDWLATMSKLQNHNEQKRQIYEKIVSLITVPTAYICLKEKGRAVSLAYGATHSNMLCVESVITDEGFRGKGYAKRMLAMLLAWAPSIGAQGICIQVQADNQPALALYNNLGLREIYRYHYLRQPTMR